jgi:hypothetical protein
MGDAGPATAALYAMTPNQGTGCPQCSQASDFCFLCEFSSADDTDAVAQVKLIAHELTAEKKEIGVVAAAMVEAYDELARAEVAWRAPNGEVVAAPPWTRTSAARHLMFSAEFQAFDNAVDQIFHTLIYKLNATAVERDTGAVIEDTRRALVDTISKYSHWKTAQHNRLHNATGGVSGARKRKMYSH